jgi:hypothetical protein
MATQIAQTIGGNEWPVAEPVEKRFKIFIAGPPGCFKTRVALSLADNGNRKSPAAAVIDTEFGTKHYAEEFAFRRQEVFDPVKIYRLVKGLAKDPGDATTLVFDSFSVYYDALMEHWVEKFQRREITSAGNKSEYYTLQPRDYVHINRDAGKLVRIMLECDMNVICTCQVKAEWENMKVVGSIFDGWKRLPYFFDIYIFVEEWKKQGGAMGWKAYIKGKDRTGCLSPGQKIDWEDSAAISAYLTEKFGQKLSEMPKAASYDADADKSVSIVSADVEKQAKDAGVDVVKEEGKAGGTPQAPGAETDAKETTEKPNPAVEKDKAVTEKATPQAPEPVPSNTGEEDVAAEGSIDKTAEAAPGLDNTPVQAKKELLVEIVRLKKLCKISDQQKWVDMVAQYKHVETGEPLKSAVDMVAWQAEDFIRILTRMAP